MTDRHRTAQACGIRHMPEKWPCHEYPDFKDQTGASCNSKCVENLTIVVRDESFSAANLSLPPAIGSLSRRKQQSEKYQGMWQTRQEVPRRQSPGYRCTSVPMLRVRNCTKGASSKLIPKPKDDFSKPVWLDFEKDSTNTHHPTQTNSNVHTVTLVVQCNWSWRTDNAASPGRKNIVRGMELLPVRTVTMAMWVFFFFKPMWLVRATSPMLPGCIYI